MTSTSAATSPGAWPLGWCKAAPQWLAWARAAALCGLSAEPAQARPRALFVPLDGSPMVNAQIAASLLRRSDASAPTWISRASGGPPTPRRPGGWAS
jgi:hypothetical protein